MINYKKRCVMCGKVSFYSTVITSSGNRALYFCSDDSCGYAEPVVGKY